uniref:Uncharacterized protein n=1 Tax=Panagrolaimus superbus TaxID=310955 RepID=A0A914XZL4_9BILA
MSDTFVRGLSLELFTSLMGTVTQALHSLADDIINQTGIPSENVENISAIIENAQDYIRDNVLNVALEDHAKPMRRVLGVLPIDEMAELAETLINLQSLKEKVTRPSETVGGPVDVAVITKCEGLIWIKRKHYFNLDINARYTQRLSATHGRH